MKDNNENIAGLVVHPENRAKFRDEIIKTSGLQRDAVFDATQLNDTGFPARIKRMAPDIMLSVNFGYLLKKDLIRIPPMGAINLHISYLPYNRGAYPNVWCIVDGTPAGATLHYIDEGIDTGDIIAQKKIEVDLLDTGETVYKKLEQVSLELFKENWEKIKHNKINPVKQPNPGTYHGLKDVESIDKIDLNKKYLAKDLINILRARTFPPHNGAYIEYNGRKIYLQLWLFEN